MKLDIEYTKRTAYAEVRETHSISILCTDRDDGIKYFEDHYPAAQGYEITEATESNLP